MTVRPDPIVLDSSVLVAYERVRERADYRLRRQHRNIHVRLC